MPTAIGHRVLLSRRKGRPSRPYAWDALRDTDLLLPIDVTDPVAPAVGTASMLFNFPAAIDHVWNWRQHFAPDDAVAIVSDHALEADRYVLFAGFVADVDFSYGRTASAKVTAVGTAFRLAHDRDYLVYGRHMLAQNGKVYGYGGPLCSFNAGGRPNRSATLYGDIDGAPDRGVALFTGDDDVAAVDWTFTAAVEYLLWSYNAPQLWLGNHAFAAADYADDPVVQLSVNGLSVWDALAALAEHAGWDLFVEYAYAGPGEIAGTIVLRRIGAGTVQAFDHQPPAADGSLAVLDTDDTNLFAATIAEAVSSCVTTPVVAGGTWLYEITIELRQAWDPADLSLSGGEDVIAPGKEIDNAGADYVMRYCTTGSLFPAYAAVGRLWDANTDGRFSGAPWNLPVPDLGALTGNPAGLWPTMAYAPKRMLTALAANPLSAGVETYLEWTIDAGANWHRLIGYRLQRRQLGVYLTVANLAAIVPLGGTKATDNLAEKLLTVPGNVRMRLTCSVASPVRSMAMPGRRQLAGTAFEQAAWFDRGAAGQKRVRCESSRFHGSDLSADEADNRAELAAAAVQLQALNEDRFIEAALPLEWIAPTIGLGDRVERIGGIGVDLRTNAGPQARCPRVVGRRFHLTPEQYQTTFTLDTWRKVPVR